MLGSNAPCQFTCASTKVWLRMQHDLYTNLLPDLSILSAGIISLLPISCECTTSVSRPLWLDSGVGETCPCQRRGTPTVKSPEPVLILRQPKKRLEHASYSSLRDHGSQRLSSFRPVPRISPDSARCCRSMHGRVASNATTIWFDNISLIPPMTLHLDRSLFTLMRPDVAKKRHRRRYKGAVDWVGKRAV